MRKTIFRYVFSFLLLAVVSALLLPLVFMLTGSFMSTSEVEYNYSGAYSGYTPGGFAHLVFVPRLFTLEQYGQVFLNSPDDMCAYWNSISLLLPTLAGLMLVAPLAGFSLAKYRYRGKIVISSMYILLALLPYHTMIVPNYIMLHRLNLLNSRASVWLTQIFHPLAVFICWRWMDKIPDELLESSEMDGANTLQKYVYIVLPQSKPALATVLVLSAADLWNMIEQPLVFFSSPELYPLSVVLSTQGSKQIGTAFVCGIIFSIPMILLFLLLKDDFLYGTQSAVSSDKYQAAGRKGMLWHAK